MSTPYSIIIFNDKLCIDWYEVFSQELSGNKNANTWKSIVRNILQAKQLRYFLQSTKEKKYSTFSEVIPIYSPTNYTQMAKKVRLEQEGEKK